MARYIDNAENCPSRIVSPTPIGAKGNPGKSAYQIAVDNGFVGTETEWLASLKGEQGEQGERGLRGATGAKGDKGDPGTTDYNELENKPDLNKKENISNKVSTWQQTPNDTHYPSEKLVKDSLNEKIDKSDVTTLDIVESTDDLQTAASDEKLITAAAVAAIFPAPIVATVISDFKFAARIFNKNTSYDVVGNTDGKPSYCIRIVSGYAKYFECTTAHTGSWNASHFSDLGFVLTLPNDLDMRKHLPACKLRNAKLELSNGILATQASNLVENGTSITVSFQFLNAFCLGTISITFDSMTGAVTGCAYSGSGVVSE